MPASKAVLIKVAFLNLLLEGFPATDLLTPWSNRGLKIGSEGMMYCHTAVRSWAFCWYAVNTTEIKVSPFVKTTEINVCLRHTKGHTNGYFLPLCFYDIFVQVRDSINRLHSTRRSPVPEAVVHSMTPWGQAYKRGQRSHRSHRRRANVL